jgi:hypothetical protein
MDFTNVVVALIAATAGFAAGYLFAVYTRPRGTDGVPDPDTVDCFGGVIQGHLDPANCDEPEDWRAKIYSCTSTIDDPNTLPPVTHLGTAPNFKLSGVPRESGATGCCLVVVWVKYRGAFKPAVQEVFHCGGGSGSPAIAAAGGGGSLSAPLFRLAPRQYQLSVGQLLQTDPAWLRALGAQEPVVLSCASGPTEIGRSSCWSAKSTTGIECRLVVSAGCCSNAATGELTLHVPDNGRAAQRLVYVTNDWNFTGHNRVSLAQPAPAADLPRTLTITPA